MASAKPSTKPPEPAPPRDSRAFTLVKQVSAVVALVAGVAGLVFLFFPQLRPDDPPSAAAPAEQFGRLSGLVLDPDTTRKQYLQRTDQPMLGFTPAQLARRGAFVRFRVELAGYRDKSVPLEREVVDAQTGDDFGQVRADVITPPADRVSSPWRDWVPLRPGRGSYVIVIKLLAEDRTRELDCVQSPPFGGLAGAVSGKKLGLCAG